MIVQFNTIDDAINYLNSQRTSLSGNMNAIRIAINENNPLIEQYTMAAITGLLAGNPMAAGNLDMLNDVVHKAKLVGQMAALP